MDSTMTDYSNVPDFDSLPAVEGMPQGCAWGVFDRDGKKDRLGCLNYLTPAVIRAAYAEARDGITVSLNYPLDGLNFGFRKVLNHKVMDLRQKPAEQGGGFRAYDDEIEFNTQCSSQWDSLLHFMHQESGKGYNGCDPSVEQLTQHSSVYDPNAELPSLDHWHDKGGLVGRGVLLDYRAYARAKGIQYSCFERCEISTNQLEAIAAFEGVELKHGDILIIRSGFVEDLHGLPSAEQRNKLLSSKGLIGVKGDMATARWFWNHHFAAVAGDMIAFEVLPPQKEDGTTTHNHDLVLHPYFLSFFGLHIGELWSLEALADHCAKTKRYSFLLTSIPLNVPGSVASPPNALALF